MGPTAASDGAEASPAGVRVCVTTAINYANGAPHMGHAYEAISADVIARYHRAYGREVRTLRGSARTCRRAQPGASPHAVPSPSGSVHDGRRRARAEDRGDGAAARRYSHGAVRPVRVKVQGAARRWLRAALPRLSRRSLRAGAEREAEHQQRRVQPDHVGRPQGVLPAHLPQVAGCGRHLPRKLRGLVRACAALAAARRLTRRAAAQVQRSRGDVRDGDRGGRHRVQGPGVGQAAGEDARVVLLLQAVEVRGRSRVLRRPPALSNAAAGTKSGSSSTSRATLTSSGLSSAATRSSRACSASRCLTSPSRAPRSTGGSPCLKTRSTSCEHPRGSGLVSRGVTDACTQVCVVRRADQLPDGVHLPGR